MVTDSPVVRVVLNLPDLSCGHCAQTVMGALTPLEGVEDVTVDLPTKSVQVAYNPHRVTLERISEILADEAYPVASMSESHGAS